MCNGKSHFTILIIDTNIFIIIFIIDTNNYDIYMILYDIVFLLLALIIMIT